MYKDGTVAVLRLRAVGLLLKSGIHVYSLVEMYVINKISYDQWLVCQMGSWTFTTQPLFISRKLINNKSKNKNDLSVPILKTMLTQYNKTCLNIPYYCLPVILFNSSDLFKYVFIIIK